MSSERFHPTTERSRQRDLQQALGGVQRTPQEGAKKDCRRQRVKETMRTPPTESVKQGSSGRTETAAAIREPAVVYLINMFWLAYKLIGVWRVKNWKEWKEGKPWLRCTIREEQ